MRLQLALLALLAAPSVAGAQSITAEQAIENQRRQLQAATGLAANPAADCEASSDPEEIIVCGREDDGRYRLPLPVEPEPGARRRLVGEPPTGTEALGAGRCFRLCQGSAGVDIFDVVEGAVRAVGRLLDPDE